MPGFGGPHAGGRKDARAHVHHAHAADADGIFVLLVAKRGNGDAVHARGVEDGRARGHADLAAVDRELDHFEWRSCRPRRAQLRSTLRAAR